MGNKLYVTQVPTRLQNHAPDNTLICQVKISRAAMKAAQKKLQSSKAPAKERKIYFFS
jgi:large subunit ribosomal protein L25